MTGNQQGEDSVNRRTVLKTTGAITGSSVLLSGAGSADTENPISTEEMGEDDQRSLIGAVMSSQTYKSVRNQLKDDGFSPVPGDGIAEYVKHTQKNEQVDRLTIPCKTRGNGDNVAEVVGIRTPNGELQTVGVIASGAPMSEGGDWVKQHVSTPAALQETESGVYTIGPVQEES